MSQTPFDGTPDDALATLLAHLSRRAWADHADGDLDAWRQLGPTGVSILIGIARKAVRSLAFRHPRATGPWRLQASAGFVPGPPLRLMRRVLRLDPDLAVAGAVRTLADLDARHAATALTPVFAHEADIPEGGDVVSEALADYYTLLGDEALPLLRDLVNDHDLSVLGRSWVYLALRRLAETDADLRPACIEAVSLALEPGYDRTPEDDRAAAYAIWALQDLHAVEALPQIEAAFKRDALDPNLVDLEEVREALGLADPAGGAAATDSGDRPTSEPVPSSGLPLYCLDCGRTRWYEIRHAILAINLQRGRALRDDEEDELAKRFGPLAVCHPLRCPHCGAINRYRLGDQAWRDLSALLRRATGIPRRCPANFTITRASSPVGEVHAAVAALRYRRSLAVHPENARVRLALANSLRSYGQWEPARTEYARVADDPAADQSLRAEAAYHLALLAAFEDQAPEAERWCRFGLALGPASASGRGPVDGLQGLLAEVSDSERFDPERVFRAHVVPSGIEINAPVRATKVGRNEPCPCGSGKKYKRCCGAA